MSEYLSHNIYTQHLTYCEDLLCKNSLKHWVYQPCHRLGSEALLLTCFYSNDFVSMWFIGIIFKKLENADCVNIDLTYDIQSFTDTGNSFSLFH